MNHSISLNRSANNLRAKQEKNAHFPGEQTTPHSRKTMEKRHKTFHNKQCASRQDLFAQQDPVFCNGAHRREVAMDQRHSSLRLIDLHHHQHYCDVKKKEQNV